jgi:general secretion pathway protein K
MKKLQGTKAAQVQRGAAILTAMITVVLVATLATTVLWQQWRGVEIETAERTRTQASWILTGALDWARLILREDARKGGADYLSEPWAIPLAPARLSTFLAAEHGVAQAEGGDVDAFLSGDITDMQSRLNAANLILEGKIHEPGMQAFAKLFSLLNLPEEELRALAQNMLSAQTSRAGALMPQDLDQLGWLGLSPATLILLRPYVTILPQRTPVNLNTAPAEVIYACVPGFEMADAHRLVAARSANHLRLVGDAGNSGAGAPPQFNNEAHSVTSRFFEVRGALQMNKTMVQEISLVQRDGVDVKTLWRKRSISQPVAPLQ